MFDIGFWELGLIGVVALIVIGPEKLPGLARTTGMWVGKARRMVASAKAEIEHEMKTEELQRIIDQQARSNLDSIHEIVEETKNAVEETEKKPEYLVKAISDEDDTPAEKTVTTDSNDGPKQ
jgi:sec-independent protein translocase protein TatB